MIYVWYSDILKYFDNNIPSKIRLLGILDTMTLTQSLLSFEQSLACDRLVGRHLIQRRLHTSISLQTVLEKLRDYVYTSFYLDSWLDQKAHNLHHNVDSHHHHCSLLVQQVLTQDLLLIQNRIWNGIFVVFCLVIATKWSLDNLLKHWLLIKSILPFTRMYYKWFNLLWLNWRRITCNDQHVMLFNRNNNRTDIKWVIGNPKSVSFPFRYKERRDWKFVPMVVFKHIRFQKTTKIVFVVIHKLSDRKSSFSIDE